MSLRCAGSEDRPGARAVSLSIEDQVLDALWREHFGQPLPMRGAGEAVRVVLRTKGVSGHQIEAAIRGLQALEAKAGSRT